MTNSAAKPPLHQRLCERVIFVSLILAFIPFFHFSFVGAPAVWVSFLQGLPQILLILLGPSLVLAGQVSFIEGGIPAIVSAIVLGVMQLFAVVHSPVAEKNFVMPLTFPFLLCLGPVVASMVSVTAPLRRDELIRRAMPLLLGTMTVECVSRLLFSPYVHSEQSLAAFGDVALDEGWFYRYKQSFIFSDANSTGIALLCLIALMISFRNQLGRRHFVLAYVLMLLTFSRASIAAALIQLLIFRFWNRRRAILAVLLLCLPIVFYKIVGWYMSWYLGLGANSIDSVDKSFLSKLWILARMVEVFDRADTLQRLIGIGSGNTIYLVGMAAHNVLAVFVLEFGFVGTTLFLLYLRFVARGATQAVFLLIVPIAICSFSLFLTSMPYFYVVLGFLGAMKAVPRLSLAARWQLLSAQMKVVES